MIKVVDCHSVTHVVWVRILEDPKIFPFGMALRWLLSTCSIFKILYFKVKTIIVQLMEISKVRSREAQKGYSSGLLRKASIPYSVSGFVTVHLLLLLGVYSILGLCTDRRTSCTQGVLRRTGRVVDCLWYACHWVVVCHWHQNQPYQSWF